MSARRMFIVAGPPGGGKSSLFSLSDFAARVFNADDRAAELNAGSYQNIPLAIRLIVNREFEDFVYANIHTGTSFALETTLRSTVTFEQARRATENGFRVSMWNVALDTVDRHIERVKRRAARGGHAASEAALRRIHARMLLVRAHLRFHDTESIKVENGGQRGTHMALGRTTRQCGLPPSAGDLTVEDPIRARQPCPNRSTSERGVTG